jgi:hypothetical protein
MRCRRGDEQAEEGVENRRSREVVMSSRAFPSSRRRCNDIKRLRRRGVSMNQAKKHD